MAKELKNVNFAENFSNPVEAQNFFDEMKNTDKWSEVQLNECEIKVIGPDSYSLVCGSDEYPIHPMAMGNIETVSEADANGNYLYSNQRYAEIITELLRLHPDKCKARFVTRGGTKEEPGLLIGYHTLQYQRLDQADLFEAVMNYLSKRIAGYQYVSGSYEHAFTKVVFLLDNAITKEYKDAWKKAGLDERLLDRSEVYLTFTTNDVGSSQARVVLTCKTGGDKFLLGEPKEVKHRVGGGSLSSFAKQLESIDITIEEEMSSIAKLMGVTILHPESVVIRAIKKAKLDTLSKKACKELVEEMFFTGATSAYVIYLFLHGILNNGIGAGLSEERKFRILTAIRGLLKEDWTKFDKPGAVTL